MEDIKCGINLEIWIREGMVYYEKRVLQNHNQLT